MNADIARAWIFANAIALIVSAAFSLIGYAIRKLLGADAGDATFVAQSVYVAAEVLMSVVSFALYARLTGVVLASVVPAVPQHAWLRLHLAFGVVLGLCVGLLALQPEDAEPFDWSDRPLLIFMFGMFVVGGGLLGVAGGALQARVLRPAVRGLGLWIACSAAAAGTFGAAVLAGYLLVPHDSPVVVELVSSAVTVVAGLVGAIIMLPAVQRLRPRVASI